MSQGQPSGTNGGKAYLPCPGCGENHVFDRQAKLIRCACGRTFDSGQRAAEIRARYADLTTARAARDEAPAAAESPGAEEEGGSWYAADTPG